MCFACIASESEVGVISAGSAHGWTSLDFLLCCFLFVALNFLYASCTVCRFRCFVCLYVIVCCYFVGLHALICFWGVDLAPLLAGAAADGGRDEAAVALA